jgi:hypothetical protein
MFAIKILPSDKRSFSDHQTIIHLYVIWFISLPHLVSQISYLFLPGSRRGCSSIISVLTIDFTIVYYCPLGSIFVRLGGVSNSLLLYFILCLTYIYGLFLYHISLVKFHISFFLVLDECLLTFRVSNAKRSNPERQNNYNKT